MASIIAAQDLYREFRTVKRQPGVLGAVRTLFTRQYDVVRAADHVSFSIERGELVGYIGPNGAGKSTTIKMLTGVLVPTSGYVETGGLVPHKHRQTLAGRIGAIFGQLGDSALSACPGRLLPVHRFPTGRIHQLLSGDAVPEPDGGYPLLPRFRLPDAAGGLAFRHRLFLLAGGDQSVSGYRVMRELRRNQ